MELHLYSHVRSFSVVSNDSETVALSQVDCKWSRITGCEHCWQRRNAKV